MPGMTTCHARGDVMSRQGQHHVIPGMTSCHARDDIVSFPEWHRARDGITHDNALCSNDHNFVRAALAGPCRSCSFVSVLDKAGAFSWWCCTYWWTGLMLGAAVTAVRGLSFKPIHPLSAIWGLCWCNSLLSWTNISLGLLTPHSNLFSYT